MSETTGRLLVPVLDTCAALGGLSRTTLYQLVNDGQLVKVKIGRRGFITASSLAAYINRLEQESE